MKWLAWGCLLFVQNASFTWVSRARNSSSIAYHAVAAVASNGVWFASQFILIGAVINELKTPGQAIAGGLLYILATVSGSVAMHYASLRWLESGRRKPE